MEPIVLIHGYSAEGRQSDPASIAGIYGDLPGALRQIYGSDQVLDLYPGRYISLEDGITLDDVALGLQRALELEFPRLLTESFHAIVHSTGALVLRNWLRRHSAKPSPVRKVIYLAGALFGSGWAHIGRGRLAQWARYVFQGGTERGVQVLDALELGSDWTLDLHGAFLEEGSRILEDYGINEYALIGSEPESRWFTLPIRYAKEDGSDGVVRVAAGHPNFHYLKLVPTDRARRASWEEARDAGTGQPQPDRLAQPFYAWRDVSRPGLDGRSPVPWAIPCRCAHTGDRTGIVSGSGPRRQVLRLIRRALDSGPMETAAVSEDYRAETERAYARIAASPLRVGLRRIDRRAQYDPHAQLIFRLRDQDRRPVVYYDIFFTHAGSRPGAAQENFAQLIEAQHRNERTPNVLTFYLRTGAFDAASGDWVSRLARLRGLRLEITAVEPQTERIRYLPVSIDLTAAELVEWIQGHRTTIIDVELWRLPGPEVFQLARYSLDLSPRNPA